MKGLIIGLLGIGLMACTSAPRYHYGTPQPPAKHRTTKKAPAQKPPAMLIQGVQHTAVMTASFYGHNDGFDGKKAANGEIFDKNAYTAAHKSLPFGTVLKVTYPKTGRSVNVRINDRGPYVSGRDIDLSYGAAKKIGLVQHGVGQVRVTVIKWGSGETRQAP